MHQDVTGKSCHDYIIKMRVRASVHSPLQGLVTTRHTQRGGIRAGDEGV